ncbi:hypothetical protein EYS14_24785 [Alteromonadaceae bacterium M269]|nr:hypothetical protein EYS14_24785 [Alteromonadaceae bacterium M269]
MGISEKRQKADWPLNSKTDLDAFVKDNEVGFFLHAQKCLYNITLNKRSFSTLVVYFEPKDNPISWIEEFFEKVQACSPQFGYAANSEEFEHRNQVFSKQGKNNIYSWVGRSLEKYLPGVYSITYISSQQIAEKEVDIELLKDNTETWKDIDGVGYLLVFSEKIEEWRVISDKLDLICKNEGGIFSKHVVEQRLKNCTNFLEVCAETDKWE